MCYLFVLYILFDICCSCLYAEQMAVSFFNSSCKLNCGIRVEIKLENVHMAYHFWYIHSVIVPMVPVIRE